MKKIHIEIICIVEMLNVRMYNVIISQIDWRRIMLVRFSVENYRSFNERQVFSMAAGKHTRHKKHLALVNGKRLLKGSVLFGANAAGKSNLIRAISFGRDIVYDGVSAGQTFNRNFRIDNKSISRPGIFQYDFVSNKHFYSYGFAISYLNSTIVSEWLYLVDDGKEIAIFERDEKGEITTDIKFKSKESKQRFYIYSEDVARNKTFLNEIVSHKLREIEDFLPFFDTMDWFKSLIIIFPQTKINDFRQFLMNDSIESLGKLLNYFDTGIEAVHGEEKSMDDILSFLPNDVKSEVISDIQNAFSRGSDSKQPFSVEITIAGRRISFSKNKDGNITAAQLMMNHGNDNDLFELADESDGTRRLFDLIPLYKKGKQNYVILVDELDRSFHTKLTIEFIEKFFEKTEGIATQLIVTLHDSNVMNLNLLRQDEIWFVERRADHSTEIYSLNKFNERFDHSVAKDYLLGRYGSVPNFGVDFEEEGESDEFISS